MAGRKLDDGEWDALDELRFSTNDADVFRNATMILMSGLDLPVRAIRQQVASALDLIVHLERLDDGSRKVTHITEVAQMESDVITLADLFTFKIESVTAFSLTSVLVSFGPTVSTPRLMAPLRKKCTASPASSANP